MAEVEILYMNSMLQIVRHDYACALLHDARARVLRNV